jgi:hypothetical protein
MKKGSFEEKTLGPTARCDWASVDQEVDFAMG